MKEILSALLPLLQKHSGPIALISDKTVASLYGSSLLSWMKEKKFPCLTITFPAGEKNKTRDTKEWIEDTLLEKKCGRDTLLIALGGGVVTDLGGFVAATYMRGIPYLSIPTTLMGMVDASIGGKTGVNTPKGKNLIGAFHPPQAVLTDTTFLTTLPPREMLSGTAEVIKYGLIATPSLLKSDFKDLKAVVQTCSRLKQTIITEDPKDEGKRKVLNFGHTIGHAIETVEDYHLSHGEAIAMGMIIESFIAHQMGKIDQTTFQSIFAVFQERGFPLRLSARVTLETLQNQLSTDKKGKQGAPRFVILTGMGRVDPCGGTYCAAIPPPLLDKALKWGLEEFGS